MKITVVYVVNKLRNSGPVRVMLDIIKYLDMSRFAPVIVTLMEEDQSRSIKNTFEGLGVQIISYMYNFWQLEFQPSKIAKRIESECNSFENVIYHAHSYQANTIIANMSSKRTVATVHCISGEDYVINYGAIQGRYMSLRYRRNLKNIKYPVAISEYMADYYKSVAPHLKVITNGVDFIPGEIIDSEICKRKLGCQDRLVILVSGAFSKRKNQQLIIHELRNLSIDFLCIFIGKGDLLEKCKTLATGDDRFIFKGYVFNVQDYIKAADVVVSASLSEGMPLAVLESINIGSPVLLSSIPPHIEIYRKMKGIGVGIFHHSKKGGLLEEIRRFVPLDNLRRKQVANMAYSIYSATRMSDNYQELYSQIIND